MPWLTKNKPKNKPPNNKRHHTHVRNVFKNTAQNKDDDRKQTIVRIIDAVIDNKLDVLKELLNADPTLINAKGHKTGATILHVAVMKGSIDIVKYILEWDKTHKTLDINIKNNDGITPLYYAVSREKGPHIEIINELLKRDDIDVNVQISKQTNVTPLLYAAFREDYNVIKALLLHKNINVNQGDVDGDTPLLVALRDCKTLSVEELLRHKKIDVNKANNNGFTPLDYAIKFCKSKIISLLEKGADINARKSLMELIALDDVELNEKIKILEEILKWDKTNNKLDVNIEFPLDNEYYKYITPLIYAIQNSPTEIVNILLEHKKIEVNKADGVGNTPLIYSLLRCRKDIVDKLLKHKDINVNQPNKDNYNQP